MRNGRWLAAEGPDEAVVEGIDEAPRERVRRRARLALAAAIAGGAVTQALFWRTSIGLNWLLAEVGVIGAMVALFGARSMRAGAWAAIGVALALGGSLVVYTSDWQLFIAVPASLAVVALLPTILRARLGVRDLGELPRLIFAKARSVPDAILDTARMPSEALEGAGWVWVRALTRGALIGLPTAGFFALLFAADAGFAGAVSGMVARCGEWVLFAIASGATSLAYLLDYGLERAAAAAVTPPTVDRGGAPPYRREESAPAEASASGGVSPITWAAVLAQVALVFGIFVIANRQALFGGHGVVRASDGPTYAAYLHAGFAQLLVATVLSVCLVLAGHRWMRPRGASGAAAAPGGRALAVVETGLLLLAAITVASCWQRLSVYEDAYGATHLRLGVAVLEIGVLGVLGLTVAKSIARGWRGYGGALIGFAALLSIGACAFNADGYIAAQNLDRAARGKPLDFDYLGTLSRDACGALEHPRLVGEPALQVLEARWTGPRAGGWRAFRGIGGCGR